MPVAVVLVAVSSAVGILGKTLRKPLIVYHCYGIVNVWPLYWATTVFPNYYHVTTYTTFTAIAITIFQIRKWYRLWPRFVSLSYKSLLTSWFDYLVPNGSSEVERSWLQISVTERGKNTVLFTNGSVYSHEQVIIQNLIVVLDLLDFIMRSSSQLSCAFLCIELTGWEGRVIPYRSFVALWATLGCLVYFCSYSIHRRIILYVHASWVLRLAKDQWSLS